MPCKSASVKKDASEWIIVKNMHEAIVTEEEFNQAQRVITGKPFCKAQSSQFPLKSLVVCGNCLHKMKRKKDTLKYFCSYGQNGGDELCRSNRSPKEKCLEETVFHAIQDYIKLADKHNMKKERILRTPCMNVDSASVEFLKSKIESLKQKKFNLYDRYVSGAISKNDYSQKKQAFDEEISRAEADLKEAEARYAAKEADENTLNSELEAMCEAFRGEEALTYDMAHAFVDRILVYPDERVEIQWKFRDCFLAYEGESDVSGNKKS